MDCMEKVELASCMLNITETSMLSAAVTFVLFLTSFTVHNEHKQGYWYGR